jgi:O-antigen/teichoic acid export membrane protein
MREVGRNAVLGSLSTAGGSLLGFVARFAMNAVLARHIAPDAFGVYAQGLVYASFVGLLLAFSFPQALLQLPDMPGLQAAVRRLTAGSVLAMVSLSALLYPLIAHFRGAGVAECFAGLVAGQAIAAYGGTFEGELLRQHRWHATAGLRLAANAATVALVVPIGVAFPGPLVLVLRDALVPVLLISVMAWLRRRKGSTPSAYQPAAGRAVWSLGRALFWNRGLEIVLHKVDSALVGELLGQRALAHYDQARYLASLPAALVSPVSNIVGLPLMASLGGDPARRARAFWLLEWGVARVVFLFALGCVLAPELAVRVIFGPDWAGSAPILQVLALWCALVPISTNHLVLLTATQSWQAIRLGFITALLVLVPGLLALIPLWSALGAAAASTLAVAAELAIRARGTARQLGARTPPRLALPLLTALSAGGAGGYLVSRVTAPTWGGQALVLGAGLLAALVTLTALEGRRAVRELRYLRDLIRRRS